MILVSICVILLSVVIGLYGIAILINMRREIKSDFVNSLFYYHLLIFLFGIYGILGGAFIREILLKFGTEIKIIELVAQFIPFIGIPFLIAAWFIFIKLAADLASVKMPQWITITYFTVCTFGFLLDGYLINNLALNLQAQYESMRQLIRIGFYSTDIIINLGVTFFLILRSTSVKSANERTFMVRFGLLGFFISAMKGISLHFAMFSIIAGYYFLVVYFSGNLLLILLSKVYYSKQKQFSVARIDVNELYTKLKITQREKEIIEHICLGKTNREIAEELFITLQTVKDHTYNIFRKVNVTNRVQLVQLFNTPDKK
jgi:DNA-binding NarL/FixJ family response regulator